jgi:hypothetical protein
LLVYASGVKATTNCFSNFRIKPTPIVDGDPRLHAAPGCPAIMPHDPYARTSGLLSFCMLLMRLYNRASLRWVFM